MSDKNTFKEIDHQVSFTNEELRNAWIKNFLYECCHWFVGLAEEISQLRSNESQLKIQLQDVKKRENVLVLKLAAKEQEANEYRVLAKLF